MRLTAEFFVAALIRRVQGEGAFAAVVRRGHGAAGAIFVKVARLDGTADLYGPAPQAAFGEDAGERLFERLAEAVPEAEADERLRREARFDSDLWIVEIEDRRGRAFLDLAPLR